MNVLMVGAGKGSWDVRGVQMGHALDARVTSTPTPADWQWAEIAVLVKRYGVRFASMAQAAGVPIVWDAVDFWAQPADNGADPARALALLDAQVRVIRPTVTLGATQAMADAAHGAYLPHHSWRGLEPQAPRPQVEIVGYQGNALYLDRWRAVLERLCNARGWRFVINPPDLWLADILVALRAGPWDGWICRQWKSGVKLVNALAAGRPILTQPTAAAAEINAPGSVVETTEALDAALTAWTPYEARVAAYEACRERARAYRLPAVRDRYRALLAEVRTACPA